jgi:hypothetical protein
MRKKSAKRECSSLRKSGLAFPRVSLVIDPALKNVSRPEQEQLVPWAKMPAIRVTTGAMSQRNISAAVSA